MSQEALRAYLSASAHNYVVLTNYAAMEAYKGDTLKSIYSSMEILAQHPKQVIILTGTQDICALNGHAAALLEPLIDEVQTRDFSEYCQHLLAAKGGDLSLQGQLLEHGREATAYIERMLNDMPTLSSGIDLMAKTYSRNCGVRGLRISIVDGGRSIQDDLGRYLLERSSVAFHWSALSFTSPTNLFVNIVSVLGSDFTPMYFVTVSAVCCTRAGSIYPRP